MAKKKHQGKRHRFKHTETSGYAAVDSEVVVGSEEPTTDRRVRERATLGHNAVPAGRGRILAPAGPSRDFSYVGYDLRRIGVLAAVLVALELVLWYLFSHTGLGEAVYRLVQV